MYAARNVHDAIAFLSVVPGSPCEGPPSDPVISTVSTHNIPSFSKESPGSSQILPMKHDILLRGISN